MNDNDKTFIGWAVSECVKEGVKVVFSPKESIETDGDECAGYFNEGDKELVVATKKSFKNFFPIFLHEFCHFKQWQNDEPLFMKISKNTELDSDMWNWLQGKDIPIKRVRKSINAYRRMELNCEEKAVKYIEEFKLSINKEPYIQAANVYVLFYGILEKTRKWYKYSPYDDRLFDLVPSTFIKNFKISKAFRKRVMSVCY